MDRMEDSHITDEMLAAYLDGNATDDECRLIESSVGSDGLVSEIMSVFGIEEESLQADMSGIIEELMTGYDMMESPGDFNNGSNDDMPVYGDNVLNDGNLSNDKEFVENITLFKINDTMKTLQNFEAADRIFGEEGNGTNPIFDPMLWQGPEGVCAIRSQQIILRDYGIDVSLEELKQFAIQNGWYEDGGGTPMGYVGAIINACGVGVRQDVNCTVYDLVNELAQGHRVIVGVDANELWADRDGKHFVQAKEFFKDLFKEEANHALIVAGVKVNPNDPEDVKVVLTDPGTGDLRIEYTLDQFMDAWEDSNCFMTTTTTPAPYQYDELRGCMVPSNFAVEQFVDANSLPLQADVRVPDDYLASNAYYSEGHLNSVGQNVGYDEFSDNYTRYKSVLNVPGSFGQDHFDLEDFKSAMKSLFASASDNEAVVPVVPDPKQSQSPDQESFVINSCDPDDDNNDDDDDDEW